MNSVAVFKWGGSFLPEAYDQDPESLTTQRSKPAADQLLHNLSSAGIQPERGCVTDHLGGWEFSVRVQEQRFSVFVMWTGIGTEDEDIFAIQVNLKRGIFATLFLSPVRDERLEPICTAIDEALWASEEFIRVQWISDQQFEDSYCGGEPLPSLDGVAP